MRKFSFDFKKKQKEKPERQQPMTAEGKRQMRRRRARRRVFIRSLIVLLTCLTLVFVWQNWDWLAPDKLIASITDWLTGGDGSYPVDLSGTNVQRLVRTEDYTVLVTDSHVVYYDSEGAEMNRYHYAVSNSLVRTAGDYVLVAEQGGRRLHLSTRSDIELEFSTDHNILSVALNEEGQIAVLTDGPQNYQIQVKVYDDEGKVLYTRSRNRTATDVALSPDGKQVALLSVEASDGDLNTYIEAFSLSSSANEATYSHIEKDVLLYRLAYFSENCIGTVAEDRVVILNAVTGGVHRYTLEDQHILGYAIGEDRMAVALRPYGDTADGTLVLLNGSGKAVKTASFSGDFRQLSAFENEFVVLTDRYVQKFSESGLGGKASVEADGRQAVLDEDLAVVLGVSQLDAYELK